MEAGPLPEPLRVSKSQQNSFSEQALVYSKWFVEGKDTDAESMVKAFYDLVTEFYEWGWGESFHFAPRHANESLQASLIRLEHYVALRLGLGKDMRVLDVGCGVGGPLRTIAHLSNASVVGITNHVTQAEKTNIKIEKEGLSETCCAITGTFMEDIMAQIRAVHGDDTALFDAAFAIESTCHADDKEVAFKRIFDSLKPGGRFVCTDWCLTSNYDPKNVSHVSCISQIREGNALPSEIATQEEVLAALQSAGFVVDHAEDLSLNSAIGWESPLAGKDSVLSAFRATRLGRRLTHGVLVSMQSVGLVPAGSVDVHRMLCNTADALVEAARLGIFTPLFFTVARKPETVS